MQLIDFIKSGFLNSYLLIDVKKITRLAVTDL